MHAIIETERIADELVLVRLPIRGSRRRREHGKGNLRHAQLRNLLFQGDEILFGEIGIDQKIRMQGDADLLQDPDRLAMGGDGRLLVVILEPLVVHRLDPDVNRAQSSLVPQLEHFGMLDDGVAARPAEVILADAALDQQARHLRHPLLIQEHLVIDKIDELLRQRRDLRNHILRLPLHILAMHELVDDAEGTIEHTPDRGADRGDARENGLNPAAAGGA